MNNSLVVFVHGIFGDVWSTWKSVPAIIQHEVEHDPLLDSYDFYSFGYESRFFHQPQLDPFAVDGLRSFVESVAPRYDTMVLICHSQGGILGKLYLCEELSQGRGEKLKVDCIITLGTPHKGRRLLNPLLWLQNTPLLKSILPFWQLGQLASLSRNISRIRELWTETHVSKAPSFPGPNAGTYARWR